MSATAISLTAFACLFGAALVSLLVRERLPAHHRSRETCEVINLAFGMLILMASVILGLMTESARSSFESANQNLHRFSVDIVLLGRTLRDYGPDGERALNGLVRYTERALEGTWPTHGQPILIADPAAGKLLAEVETSVRSLDPHDDVHRSLRDEAMRRVDLLIEQRWMIIALSRGDLPAPFLVLMIAWLTIIFASLGYSAPHNTVAVVTFLLCSAAIASAIFLIVEMAGPFDGLMEVSSEPLQQALEFLHRPQ
jgi:hypothetical protein